MLKLVDKPDLGSGAERRMGSIPFARTKKRTIAGSLFSYRRYARPSTLPHPYISSLGKGTCFFGNAENLADECHADTFWGISCQFGGSEYDFDTNLAISCSWSPSMQCIPSFIYQPHICSTTDHSQTAPIICVQPQLPKISLRG